MSKHANVVALEKVETGRTHMVGGAERPLEDADGSPEHVYELVARLDGMRVVLLTFAAGPIEAQVAAGTQEPEPEAEAS